MPGDCARLTKEGMVLFGLPDHVHPRAMVASTTITSSAATTSSSSEHDQPAHDELRMRVFIEGSGPVSINYF